jgi:hypothetical protein
MPKKKFSGRARGMNGTRIEGKGKARKGQKTMDWIKPPRFKDYMTLGEVSLKLGHDPRWITRLEAAGRIPKATRVAHGKLDYRLWSPAQVEEIRQIIKGHKVGRRPKDG